MQLKPLAFALLAACATSGAWAQAPSSSITVFGRADLGLVGIDDGASTSTRAYSGRYTESRWGIRGAEDLSGGLAATVYLESGISIDSCVSTRACPVWRQMVPRTERRLMGASDGGNLARKPRKPCVTEVHDKSIIVVTGRSLIHGRARSR